MRPGYGNLPFEKEHFSAQIHWEIANSKEFELVNWKYMEEDHVMNLWCPGVCSSSPISTESSLSRCHLTGLSCRLIWKNACLLSECLDFSLRVSPPNAGSWGFMPKKNQSVRKSADHCADPRQILPSWSLLQRASLQVFT